MASQQPGHNQEQPYQAYQGHQPEHAQQPQSGPGINAPLLQFSESTGRYEAPPSTHAGQGQYGSGHPPGEGFGSGGFGGEHEAGYQIPANTQHGAQHGDVHGSGFGEQHSSGFGSDHHQPGHEAPPGLPPRRTDTGAALPQGQDRSHQVEVMQSYEMSRPQTEDEVSSCSVLEPPSVKFIG